LKRCKSRPSLFFIGGGEAEEVEVKEEEVAVKKRSSSVVGGDGELSKQELFMKAEAVHWQLLQAAQDAEGQLLAEVAWALSQGFLVSVPIY